LDAKCIKRKEKKGQNLTLNHLTLILKLKMTKQIFFGKPNYDFLYVGNVHENSFLKDKKDIERLKIAKFPPVFLKRNPILSERIKIPI